MGKKIVDATQKSFLQCANMLAVKDNVSKNAALNTQGKTIGDVYKILIQNNTFMARAYRNATKGESAAPAD